LILKSLINDKINQYGCKKGSDFLESTIVYKTEPPMDFHQLVKIYDELGWNSIKLTVNELEQMCKQSWYAVYAYDDRHLVGMGRVISDGVITGLICGVCVLPSYQSRGIGSEMVNKIVEYCEQKRVNPQLMCVEGLESYYENLGFRKFTIGMNKPISR
jgi:GNAT superfamily N-acetyltransferase